MVLEARLTPGLPSNRYAWTWHWENHVSHASRALRIPSDSIRLMQCTIYRSWGHEQHFTLFLHCFATVFFDDILVHSDSLSSHIQHLETVFQTLLQGQFYLKRANCLFAQTQLEYLGHVVSGKWVEPEASKVYAMVQWPPPTLAKELRAFLGLTSFYHKFIKNYTAITTSLTSLLCKDSFEWTLTSQIVFDQLKIAMTNAPVLALPNFSESFVVEIDTTGTAMGTVLTLCLHIRTRTPRHSYCSLKMASISTSAFLHHFDWS